MSTAYFIVLDQEIPFDTSVNGKQVAQSFNVLSDLCENRNLRSFDGFVWQDLSEYLDEGFEISPPDEVWFDASEGLDWLDGLIAAVSESEAITLKEFVLEDLHEYQQLLTHADEAGAKWRFEVDL